MEFLQNLLDSTTTPILTAFILGLMTVVSPCPLATNITAVWVYKTRFEANAQTEEKLTFQKSIELGYAAIKEIVGKVWIYIVIGIAVGAGIHGYVPENFMVSLMDKSHWYSVPLSVLIGVPLYSNAAGIIPIVSVLIGKGVPLGTALAFMMAVIGLSLPEMIILKKVLKFQLIAAFVAIVAA